jgi:hypothetical protein
LVFGLLTLGSLVGPILGIGAASVAAPVVRFKLAALYLAPVVDGRGPERVARGGCASGGWPGGLYNDNALVNRDHSYLPRLHARLGKHL